MVKKIMTNFDLVAFESVPLDLPKSAYVDILLFIAGLKPSIRIGPLDTKKAFKLQSWAITLEYFFEIDEDRFVFVSKKNNVDYLIEVDQSYLEHTEELGQLLGYPRCCTKSISAIGEDNIDSYEKNVVYKWKFENEFNMINPKFYYRGYSLISHIPCSPTCFHSLSIAKNVLLIIKENKSHHRFSKFKTWLNN